MIPFIIYIVCAIICGVLHWAKYKDDIENTRNYRSLQDKIIFLYLIPLLPIVNIAAIVYAFAIYLGIDEC